MTKTNLTATIDALGQLRAQQAELKLQEAALKEALADLEPGAYEGDLFRLSITHPEREQLSDELKEEIKEVVEKYREGLSCQYRTAHIKRVKVPTYTVRARSGVKVAG